MSYCEYFGLEREPFSNAPDARFYFNSDQHGEALVRLLRSVDSNKGLAVLVGGIGTGKTTLARRMLDNLPPERYESSLLVMVHSGVTPEWILTRIALQLGVDDPAQDRLPLLRQLYDRLLAIEDSGRRAVVLIDEAQMLQSQPLMEEFRGLLNLEIPGKKLLNIVFFGMAEIEDCLRLDEPLAQRVAVKCHLRSLTVESTVAYIKHRLKAGGATRLLFAPEAITAIHLAASGVPRLINTICDNCLFETYLRRDDVVDTETVARVAADLGLSPTVSADGPAAATSSELDEIESLLNQLEDKG